MTKKSAIFPLILLFGLMFARPLQACGWWGDGEMDDAQDAISIGVSGLPLSENETFLKGMKIPNQLGFGIAVYTADKALPYKTAARGKKLEIISELTKLGFKTVIDVGTGARESGLHKKESVEAGIRYIHVPLDKQGFPTVSGIKIFHDTLQNESSRPLLVYGRMPSTLGIIWMSHRLAQNMPKSIAEDEAKMIGAKPNKIKQFGKVFKK